MSRIVEEKNIAYDDIKKKYYVNLDFGVNDEGKQIKKTKTYAKKSEARKALKEHEANRTKGLLVMPKDITLLEWLNDWIKDIVAP
ncbi:MAG: Arm DNA-binding domain-containing protein, partial [Bacillota bacterium]